MAKPPRASFDPPELAPPSPDALARAAPLFAHLMGLSGPALSSRPGAFAPVAAMATAPRRYPLAARLLARGDGAASSSTSGPSPAAAQRQLFGFVRKSAPKAQAVPQVLLEDVAQMALFDEGLGAQAEYAEGAQASMASFVIVFREELLGELQCRIEVKPDGGISATFVAADRETYATLTAQTARLRVQLEGRGLASVDVAIEQG